MKPATNEIERKSMLRNFVLGLAVVAAVSSGALFAQNTVKKETAAPNAAAVKKAAALKSARAKVNYDEAKVPKYELPDPLLMNDGVNFAETAEIWSSKRRPEILELFKREVYGCMPKVDMKKIKFETLSSVDKALNGKATRKEIRIYFDAPNKAPYLDLLVYIPNNRTGQVPCFLGLNFKGNHSTTDEKDVKIAEVIPGSRISDKPVERGASKSRWPFEKIIDAGFAVATGYYEQIVPDCDDNIDLGVRKLFQKEFPNKTAGNYPGTISAWAWGLSRALDCLRSTVSQINGNRVIVLGHSRLGKTALWAGANDRRFAAVISNDSGCGGAALSRRAFGETVEIINTAFPHWFCPNFKKYNSKENTLPVDQHELIALIALRPVYVASATDDQWADPKGEFLSLVKADPVYRLMRTSGLAGKRRMPKPDKSIGAIMRYHVRTGKHDVTDFDWMQYIKFAKEELR